MVLKLFLLQMPKKSNTSQIGGQRHKHFFLIGLAAGELHTICVGSI
jgi:hypothetical protein